MDLTLRRIGITKEQLLALTMNETKFFILVTQLANELSVLRRLVVISSISDEIVPLKDSANAFQIFCLLRIISGKLHEGNQLIQEYFVRRGIRDGYRNEADLIQALENIEGYMAQRRNSIEHIRNNYAFHHVDGDNSIQRKMNELPARFSFQNYFGEGVATTLFFGSESFTIATLLDEVLPDLQNTIEVKTPALQQELLDVMGYFDNFITNYVVCLIVKLRNREEWNRLGNLDYEEITIDVPNILDIHVPYFISRRLLQP
jgi:hypothetical protein